MATEDHRETEDHRGVKLINWVN